MVPATHDPPVRMGRLSRSGTSPSLAIHHPHAVGVGDHTTARGSLLMLKEYAHRTWRLAVTVGPLVAIALTLAAGLKWH